MYDNMSYTIIVPRGQEINKKRGKNNEEDDNNGMDKRTWKRC